MLDIHVKSSSSETTFNAWLNLFKKNSKYANEPQFPTSFREVEQLLFKCGLQQPTIYYVCDQRDHWHLFHLGDTKCPQCGRTRNEVIKYPYYSMKEQLKEDMENPIQLKKMLEWTHDSESIVSYIVVNVEL